jgi:hypothetical protein
LHPLLLFLGCHFHKNAFKETKHKCAGPYLRADDGVLNNLADQRSAVLTKWKNWLSMAGGFIRNPI